MLSQLGIQVLNAGLATLVSVFVIRHIGRAEYGVMSFVISYLSYFLALGSMGIDTVVIRDIARRHTDAAQLLEKALGLRYILSVATMLLVWLSVPIVTRDWRVVGLVMLLSTTLLFSAQGLYQGAFYGQLRGPILNGSFAVQSLFFTGLRLALVFLGASMVAFLATDVLAAAVGLVLSRWMASHFLGLQPRPSLDYAAWKAMLRDGWGMALAGWLIALHGRIDQSLLFILWGAVPLGGYSAAVRLSETWILLANVFMFSLFPVLSRLATEHRERAERATILAYRFLYIAIMPIAVGLVGYARPLLRLLFGPSFEDAATPLSVLAVAEIFVFSNSATYNILFSTNRQRSAALIAGASLGVNAVANLMLVPVMGPTGAALASLISYSSVPVIGLFLPEVSDVSKMALGQLVRPACAALPSVALVMTARPNPLVGCVAITVLYLVSLAALGGIDRGDLRLLKSALRGA